MSTPNYTVAMVAYPVLPGETAPTGLCLVKVNGTYQASTLATRGTLKSSGIVTSGGAVNGGVFMQSFGDIPANISGLGAGVACYVRVDDDGYLERRPSITPTDDIVGWTETDGTVHLFFGGLYNTTGGGGPGDAVSIQGVPVDPTTPTLTNKSLRFDGVKWEPGPADAASLQGFPVALTAPNPGDTLVWDGFGYSPQAGGSGDATSIQGTPVNPIAPDEGQALVCVGGAWEPGLLAADAISLQGVPVSNTPPVANQFLKYNGFDWIPAAGGGGGTDAVSIQSYPVDAAAPTAVKATLVWDGTKYVSRTLTQSDIGPDFSVSLSGGVTREVGQAASGLTFTASYTGGSPTSATLTNNNGDAPFVVPNPYTSASPPWSITKTANNASVTVTITAQPGSVTSNTNLSWQPRVFYGVAVPGTINEAFIEALASQPLASGKARTVGYTAGVAEKCYYCVPTAYGVPSGTVSGFPFGATNVGTVSVTNGFGVTQNYYVMESNLAGLGTITVVWS